jgi:hypothetical protein
MVLSLLNELPYDEYWASDHDSNKSDPLQDVVTQKRHLHYVPGLLAWQMFRGLRKVGPGDITDVPSNDRDAFTEHTGCKLPGPSAVLTAKEVPSLGAFDGECNLEALIRCLCLFAHMRSMTNKTK